MTGVFSELPLSYAVLSEDCRGGSAAAVGFAPNGEVGTLPPPRDHVREIQLVMRL